MSKTILVIDDEPNIVMFLGELFSDMGHTVLKAYSGEEGLRLLDSETPVNLIITDLKMPGISGQEVIHKVRENRLYGDVPIIIITGSVFSEDDILDKSSYQAFVNKPFEIEEFLDIVTRLIT